ncbi:hypothetical protein AWB82_04869 [Caballeronia glebae]|uniref:Uncharacterized protein n=1 Tax=Caballeronia glebae TaxID=1777143 RepID=A0A158C1F4_9BURK|nr:hypothetical protein AWB82_04869 [Caballeronia glebae]
MKREARRRESNMLRNFTCGHPLGAGYDKRPEDREARFMSERAERANDEFGVHVPNDSASNSIFQEISKCRVRWTSEWCLSSDVGCVRQNAFHAASYDALLRQRAARCLRHQVLMLVALTQAPFPREDWLSDRSPSSFSGMTLMPTAIRAIRDKDERQIPVFQETAPRRGSPSEPTRIQDSIEAQENGANALTPSALPLQPAKPPA